MSQEQLGRLRGPRGRVLSQLGYAGASSAFHWAVERGSSGALGGGTSKELLVPGTQYHVPSLRGASQPDSSHPRLYSYSYGWP